MKTTFSTTEVARILGMSVKSVQRWIDQKRLRAGRTPGGHRRIGLDDLRAFLRRQKLPLPKELVIAHPQILVIDSQAGTAGEFAALAAAKHPEWEIVGAGDAFSAGAAVEAGGPDVVILDLDMPGLDGPQVCRRIKSRGDIRPTAVIAATRHLSAKAAEAIHRCGAAACLQKPLDLDALLAAVEAALPGR